MRTTLYTGASLLALGLLTIGYFHSQKAEDKPHAAKDCTVVFRVDDEWLQARLGRLVKPKAGDPAGQEGIPSLEARGAKKWPWAGDRSGQ